MKKAAKKIVIDLGCGDYKITSKNNEKVIGVDFIKIKNVDIVHNLEKPLPFHQKTFGENLISFPNMQIL